MTDLETLPQTDAGNIKEIKDASLLTEAQRLKL
jgi:hypothetical protein